MSILRHINKMKFGVIDQDYMNQLARSTNEFDDIKAEMKVMLSKDARRGSKSFLAQIYGTAGALAYYPAGTFDFTIAWRYAWERVDFKDPHFWQNAENLVTDEQYLDPKTGVSWNNTQGCQDVKGFIGQYSCFAYNIAELSNIMTVPVVFGVNMAGSSYPEGFSPQHVPMGSLVWLTEIASPYSGSQNYYFDRQGAHDGLCE